MLVGRKPFRLFGYTVIAALLLASIGVGCGNADRATNAQPNDASTTIATPTPTPRPMDTLQAAALEYCNCFKQTMGRFDPQVEALILASVKQPQPMQFLEAEIAKITDPVAQEQAVKDLQTFSNFDAASPCVSSVSKKYGIDETDPTTLKRIIGALETSPDCRLVTALFKVAYSEGGAE